MKVGQRLFLTVLPAILGLLLVVALAYWGQYAHRVPLLVVIVAAVASIASLLITWRNTKYIASRIERLAGAPARARDGARDEIDTIENAVDHLSAEVSLARQERVRSESRAIAERQEVSEMLSRVAESATRAIDEVRLPLHILLANRFGDLNENQEEMLGAAQSAVDEAAALLGRVRLLSELDQGTLEPRRDLLRLDDLVAAMLPALRADAERRHVELKVDLAPALPRVVGDRTHLQDAVGALVRSALHRTPQGGTVTIDAERDGDTVRLTITHGAEDTVGVDHAIARRLLSALGSRVDDSAGRTEVHLPAAAMPGPR